MKRAGLVGQVVGVGRSLDNLNRAIRLRVIDATSEDPAGGGWRGFGDGGHAGGADGAGV